MPGSVASGTAYSSIKLLTKALCSSGISASIASRELCEGMPGGSTKSTPNGLSPTRFLIWASSSSISCGNRLVAP